MGYFDDLFDDLGWEAMLGYFPETVTYHDVSEDTDTEIKVVFSESLGEIVPGSDGEYDANVAMMVCAIADVADPSVNDRVTRDGEIWEVNSVERKTGGRIRLRVMRVSRRERTHEDYRTRRVR